MRACAASERNTDDERIGFSLGQIVSSGIGYDKRYLMLGGEFGNRVRASGIHYSGQNVYFALVYEFVSRVQRHTHLVTTDIFHHYLYISTAGLLAYLLHVKV
jgi:hypothetical protein